MVTSLRQVASAWIFSPFIKCSTMAVLGFIELWQVAVVIYLSLHQLEMKAESAKDIKKPSGAWPIYDEKSYSSRLPLPSCCHISNKLNLRTG